MELETAQPPSMDVHRFFCVLPAAAHAETWTTQEGLSVEGWLLSVPEPMEGRIRLIDDLECGEQVVEVTSQKESRKASMSFPQDAAHFIGTPLPVLVLQLKDLRQHCSFEVVVEDDAGRALTVHCSKRQSVARASAQRVALPLQLREGRWNRIQLDLADLVQRVFGSQFRHVLRLAVFASCRVRRLYFTDRPRTNAELPPALRPK